MILSQAPRLTRAKEVTPVIKRLTMTKEFGKARALFWIVERRMEIEQ